MTVDLLGEESHDTTLTPLDLIEKLGGFDFDPCGYAGHPTAKDMIVWPQDGLLRPWIGSVWCNPPYSDPGPWMKRMARHSNGIALVLCSTDTEWFQDTAKSAEHFLFMKGRPRFLRTDRTEVGLMRATVLIGWGATGSRLAERPVEGFYLARAA